MTAAAKLYAYHRVKTGVVKLIGSFVRYNTCPTLSTGLMLNYQLPVPLSRYSLHLLPPCSSLPGRTLGPTTNQAFTWYTGQHGSQLGGATCHRTQGVPGTPCLMLGPVLGPTLTHSSCGGTDQCGSWHGGVGLWGFPWSCLYARTCTDFLWLETCLWRSLGETP